MGFLASGFEVNAGPGDPAQFWAEAFARMRLASRETAHHRNHQ
jgi:hypothetical protein